MSLWRLIERSLASPLEETANKVLYNGSLLVWMEHALDLPISGPCLARERPELSFMNVLCQTFLKLVRQSPRSHAALGLRWRGAVFGLHMLHYVVILVSISVGRLAGCGAALDAVRQEMLAREHRLVGLLHLE